MAGRAKPVTHIKEKILIQKLRPEAILPYKERDSDIGYDITLIGRTENRAEDDMGAVGNFRTGLALTPPKGYFIEMVARSSLHKHGYMLATGVSIIDPEYTGELIVPLYKFKENAEDLEMPFRAVQLIVRPAIYAYLSMTKTLARTGRGAQGFGSTGYMPAGSSEGTYVQDPGSAAYSGDLGAYQTQIAANYPRGMPRPQAAPLKKNHMF